MTSVKAQTERSDERKSLFREYAESIIIAIVLALVIRAFVVQAFKIPSGSMEDTLLIGDHILVNKFAYGIQIPFVEFKLHLFGLLGSPGRGDIIVFPFPRDPSRDFIKRVVGLPGDRIQVHNHHVYLNGGALKEPFVKLDEQMALRSSPYRNWGPEVVPPGKLFVMGDNRDNSADSRDWGFLEDEKVKGRAFMIYWSWDGSAPKVAWLGSIPVPNPKAILLDGIRWGRIGKLLQ
ncbi:MAG: signal peptidase I [Nitrospinae bacterium]|nr:signal peptidase I [Nitrospinota bacterium]